MTIASTRHPCCRTTILTDCDSGESEDLALVSTTQWTGSLSLPSSRLGSALNPDTEAKSNGKAAPHPFTAALLARPSLPLYLQIAVFLC